MPLSRFDSFSWANACFLNNTVCAQRSSVASTCFSENVSMQPFCQLQTLAATATNLRVRTKFAHPFLIPGIAQNIVGCQVDHDKGSVFWILVR